MLCSARLQIRADGVDRVVNREIALRMLKF